MQTDRESASDHTTRVGEFWAVDHPERAIAGELSIQRGVRPAIALNGWVTPRSEELAARTVTVTEASVVFRLPTPADAVEAFKPITLHGKLDDGTVLTGLEAQAKISGGSPLYEPRFVVVGAAVDSETTYTRTRFAVDAGYWLPAIWAAPEATASIARPTIAGTIRPVIDGDLMWLEYEATEPHTLREMINSVAHATLVMMKMALGETVRLIDVRLQRTGDANEDGTWLRVISARTLDRPRPAVDAKTLLAPESITLDRLAAAIDLYDELDTLADPVATPANGPVQVTFLVQATVAEGVHRRLWPKRKRFTVPPGASLRLVRKAAVKAGADQFVSQGITDEGTATNLLQNALGHLDDVSFKTRVMEMAAEASGVSPSIFEAIPDFPDKVVTARNELAHHSVREGETEPLSRKIDRWHAVGTVTTWMLKILLLRRMGVSKYEIDYGLNADPQYPTTTGYDKFMYARATVEDIAVDLGWNDVDADHAEATREEVSR